MDIPFGQHVDIGTRPRVIVPYARIHEATVIALEAQGPLDITYHKVDAYFDYWHLLCEMWEAGDPFIIVEQDIAPWPGAVAELWGCGSWCAMPYNYGGSAIIAAHGFVKFGADILEATRAEVLDVKGDMRHWTRADTTINELLERSEFTRHIHTTPVLHLNRHGEEAYRRGSNLPSLTDVSPLED